MNIRLLYNQRKSKMAKKSAQLKLPTYFLVITITLLCFSINGQTCELFKPDPSDKDSIIPTRPNVPSADKVVSSSGFFQELPEETTCSIFMLLDQNAILSVGLVNQYCRRMATEVWKKQFLDLSNRELSNEQITNISNSIFIAINLSYNNIKSNRLQFFGNDLTKLVKIDFAGNFMGGEGLKYLTVLGNLRGLGLNGNHLRDPDLEYLVPLTNLETLDLSANYISGNGLKYLPSLKLKALDLSVNRITSQEFQNLNPCMSLMVLWIQENDIGEAGVKHIAKFSNLRKLNIYKTKVEVNWLQHLTILQHLELMNIEQDKLTQANMSSLMDRSNMTDSPGILYHRWDIWNQWD